MNNRLKRMRPEVEKQIEGLTANQIQLLASIYAGLADRFREQTATNSLAKWKARDDYGRN